jgi:hypothetical protein
MQRRDAAILLDSCALTDQPKSLAEFTKLAHRMQLEIDIAKRS